MFIRQAQAVAAVSLLALAAVCLAVRAAQDADNEKGDTKPSTLRDWEPDRDTPPPVASDKTVKLTIPSSTSACRGRIPRTYFDINHLNQAGLHQTNAPGAELRLLHPDGRTNRSSPVEPQESITDPMVSFDGQWVYFAKFHHMATGASASMTMLQSRKGADIYKIHVPTRKVVQLTTQQRTPNTGAVPPGTESHPRGVHNLAPCPVAGGKVVFVSDRNGFRGVREQTQPALQLFVMDDDGSNVELIGPLNLGTALHPVVLKDGRVMFSSLETQGLRSDERWGIWAIHPDGTNWDPLTSALGSPPGQAVHFQTQLSDESIVVEIVLPDRLDRRLRHLLEVPACARRRAARASARRAKRLRPARHARDLTLFASFARTFAPNHKVARTVRQPSPFVGNVTHPSGAPDNHLLTVWALPSDAPGPIDADVYDAGIYLIKAGQADQSPGEDAADQERSEVPRAVAARRWCRTSASTASTSRRACRASQRRQAVAAPAGGHAVRPGRHVEPVQARELSRRRRAGGHASPPPRRSRTTASSSGASWRSRASAARQLGRAGRRCRPLRQQRHLRHPHPGPGAGQRRGATASGATSRWAATPRSGSASSASSRCASSRRRQAAARSRRQSRHQLPGQDPGRRRLDVPDARQERHGAEHGPDLAPGPARRGPQRLRRLPRPQPAADRRSRRPPPPGRTTRSGT